VFALLLVAFPIGLGVKIRAQRRRLGRSPVILGAVATTPWEAWFERLGPVGLAFWPVSWLWGALGGGPVASGRVLGVGLVLMISGGALSLASVFLMGAAWRIGIDPENRTELMERGPYRWVRHPIYSGWLVLLLGNVLVVPHPVIAMAALVTVAGVTYQAHREERHLAHTFGERYTRFAARTGRFAPRLRGPRPGAGDVSG
jgi:protein-S-isoprenylcysteine O-methyltransferase Ste14